MSMNDPLASVLSTIENAAKRSAKNVTTTYTSTLIKNVLDIMAKEGYLEGYKAEATAQGERLTITLNGRLNRVGVIKPRFKVKKDEFERFEKRFLPARGFGLLVVSTNHGVLTHDEAVAKGIGGTLISYCY